MSGGPITRVGRQVDAPVYLANPELTSAAVGNVMGQK
jgi:hypothetical protein